MDRYSLETIPWLKALTEKENLDADDFRFIGHESNIGLKERLDEFTLKELKDDTEGKKVVKLSPDERAKMSEKGLGFPITCHLKGIDRDGTFHFWTTSQTTEGKKYNQDIQLLDYEASLDLLRQKDATSRQFASLAIYGDIKVYCSCVAEGTLVCTSEGHVPIENVKAGDYVLSSDGKYHRVMGVPERKEPCRTAVGIDNFASRYPVVVSEEHEICVVDADGNSTKKASGTMEGQRRIVFAGGFPFGDEVERVQMSKGEARLLGLLMVSGFVFDDEDKVCVTLVGVDEATNISSTIAGLPDLHHVERHPSPIMRKGEAYDYVLASKILKSDALQCIGFGDHRKWIRPSVFTLTDDAKREFLFGAFMSRGYINNSIARIQVGDIGLAYDVAMLAHSMGIRARVTDSTRKSGYKYEVSIPADLFEPCWKETPDIIKGRIKIKKSECRLPKIYKGRSYVGIEGSVKKIENVESGKRFFDISLLDGPHDYLANGLFVSNCPAYLYWGWQYIDWQTGSGIMPEERFPKIRNPELKGSICKHLWQVLSVLPVYQPKLMSSAKKYYPSLFAKSKKKGEDENNEKIAVILDPKIPDVSGTTVQNAVLTGENISGKNLADSSLVKMDASGANLEGCILVNADLSGANLSNSNLRKADLTGANLSNANLTNADLTGAVLVGANLDGADLTGAKFEDSQIASALNWENAVIPEARKDGIVKEAERIRLEKIAQTIVSDASPKGIIADGVDVSGQNLARKDLSGAHLENANLSRANLNGARLAGTDLSGTNLSGARLVGADLSNANLTNADLSKANLTGATLVGADLNGCNLEDATVTAEQLQKAVNLDKSIGLPKDVLEDALGITARRKKEADRKKRKRAEAIIDRIDFGERKLSGTDASGLNLKNLDAEYVDFSESDFHDADLRNSDLTRINFRKSNLSGVSFRGADLTNCDFTNCDLTNCDFTNCTLYGCRLDGADVKGAVLVGTEIDAPLLVKARNWGETKGADQFLIEDLMELIEDEGEENLSVEAVDVSPESIESGKNSGSGIVLTDSDFSGMSLAGKKFINSTLERNNFDDADVSGCDFSDSDLEASTFRNADLSNADFTDGYARRCVFMYADLSGADFTRCDIGFAKFGGTNITAEQLSKAEHWKTVTGVPKKVMEQARMLTIKK